MRAIEVASIFYAVALSTFLRCTWSQDADTVVHTSLGPVNGTRVSNPEAEAYLGIPFALPPVGPRRFRRPEPAVPWQGTFQATKFAPACYQTVNYSHYPGDQMYAPRTTVSEDCLCLNIWVPVPRPTKAPVMVWLHSGSFVIGSTSMDMGDGKYLAAREKVIVVSLAYRLGIFGFFYLGHESAPGNQGLHDQVLGLRWVQQNIENFGGDPQLVTLFGSGAGATSISLHLLSPLSQNLFHRAIMQGGVTGPPMVGWQTETPVEAKRRALLYAFEYLYCPRNEDPLSIIACLNDLTNDDIISDQIFPYNSLIFRPCVDGAFLTSPPYESLSNGYIKKCPIIIGTTRNEGSWSVFQFSPEYLNLTDWTMNRDQFVVAMKRIFLYYPNYPIRTLMQFQEKVIELYTNRENQNDTYLNLAALDAAYADAYFSCSRNEYASAYSRNNMDVYMFELTQRYEMSPWPKWMGVVHGDDVYFVFGAPPAPGRDLTDEEHLLSRAMMHYWGNFARTG